MNLTESLATLRNDTLAATFQRHYSRLESLFSGQILDAPFGMKGISVSTTDEAIDPTEWFSTSIAKLAEQASDACDDLIFRPMSICYNPHGVHFIDDLFGAEVFLHPFSGQWQANLLQTPVGALEYPDIEANASWKLVTEVAELYLQSKPPNVMFELPTLSSALNIAVNLYGQEILIAMLGDPPAAYNDLRVINDVIKDLHSWFLKRIPIERLQPIAMAGRFQPYGHGQICGCTTQLTSNELYEEFAAPLDAEVLSLYPKGGLIHLCGAHAQHIPTWEHMRQLKAVQLNDRAALDLAKYHSELRDNQILYVNCFEGMPPEKVLRISDGRRVILVGEFDETARATLREHKKL